MVESALNKRHEKWRVVSGARWPWALRSAARVLWCTAPWRCRSRRCLAPSAGWRPAATAPGWTPAPPGESGWTGGLSTHCRKHNTHTHTHTHTHSLTTFFMVAPDKMAIYPWNNQLVSFRGRCIFLSPGAKNESRLSEQSGVNVSYCCFNVIEEDEIFSYRRWITVCYIYKTSSSRNLLSPSSQFMSRGFQTKQTWEKRFKVVRVSPINIT